MANGWIVLRDEDGAVVHVLPVEDLRDHYAGADCWCRPTEDEGIAVHSSLDQRELVERGERAWQ